LVGLFSFCAGTRLVEQANTALAVAMVGGFGVLLAVTVVSAGPAADVVAKLTFADWGAMLPTLETSSTWVMPVLINLLCFSQAVPVVVERLGVNRAQDIRSALILGSAVPLMMCIAWAAVSAALLPSAGAVGDPVLQMLRSSFGIAGPVALLCVGSIGTTLVSSYLTLGQFATDAICSAAGRCSLDDKTMSSVASVALPALLACAGPQLYVPLLAFAGAFPTMLLYGLMPPLAALALRRSGLQDRRRGPNAVTTARPVALGVPILRLVVGISIGFLGVNSFLAVAGALQR